MWGYSGGFLALLEEDDIDYQVYAIDQLLEVVDLEWAQIADKLDVILKLANDASFHYHEKAALLASKTYYRLGEFAAAAKYLVKGGPLFDPTATDNFTNTVKSQLISQVRVNAEQKKETDESTLEIIYKIFDNMFDNKDYAALFCLALETRQNKYLSRCIETLPDLLPYAITTVLKNVHDSQYRAEVLQVLVTFLSDSVDEQVAKLHQFLNNPEAVAAVIITLLAMDNSELAYQIAFDLAEDASQKFRNDVIRELGEDELVLPVKDILTRLTPLHLELQFHYQYSNEDTSLIDGFIESLDTKVSTSHNAVVTLFAYMNAHSSHDQYFRDHTDWFSTLNKWPKFYSVASAGCVHIGNLVAANTIFKNYTDAKRDSEVTGGALYAIGLIHANYANDSEIINLVNGYLNNGKQMYIIYGASLALGLIKIGSQDQHDLDNLTNKLFMPDVQPECGEAFAYAIGMINLGSGPCELLSKLLEFAKDCPHERIVRGISMALGLMCYGKERQANIVYDALINSRNSVLREGAAWVLAFAYVGTGDNETAQKLLHIAVSDTSGDVRRVACIAIGLLLSRQPERVPETLGLLAMSYHAYCCSGAALAIGLSCAGTGNKECIELLKPLLKDMDPLVRQSATIGMAMILQQQSDAQEPYCAEFRKFLRSKMRKESGEMTTFSIGAAYGILNATGRKSIISCNSLRGVNSMLSTVGAALFTNYYYFIPLSLMLSLAFHTTAMIPLDRNLNIVEWQVRCKSKPSLFADPPTYAKEKDVVKLADKVELSVARELSKDEKKAAEEKEKEQQEKEDLLKNEPQEEIITNPARVTLEQIKFIDPTYSKDWSPIITPSLGFIMLKKEGEQEMDQ